MTATTPEIGQSQLTKEQYLSVIPEVDKMNLERIIQLFEKTLQELNREGALVAVGGTLTKTFPRPDIDLIVILGKNPSDLKEENFTNAYLFALQDFQTLEGIIQNMVAKDNKFQIRDTYEPKIDPEFDSPAILSHEGRIVVTTQDGIGTPFEFVRVRDRGNYQEIMAGEKRPFVVLSEVSPS